MSKPLGHRIKDAEVVVKYLEENGGEATVGELVDAVNLPAKDVHWIVESMDHLGLVEADVQLSLDISES